MRGGDTHTVKMTAERKREILEWMHYHGIKPEGIMAEYSRAMPSTAQQHPGEPKQ